MKGQQQKPLRAPRESELSYSEYMARQEAVDKIKRGEQELQPETASGPKTDPGVIARFLKQRLGGMAKLEGASLYPDGLVEARDQCIVRNRIRVQLEYNGDVPPEGVTLYVKDCVSIKGCSKDERELPASLVSLCCTWYDNASPHVLSGALNIAETYRPYAKTERDQADVQEAIGAQRHASMMFKANTKEEFQQHALHIQHVKDPRLGRINYHYGNPDFMMMTHLLDPATNLRCGLVQIPAEVCKEAGYELYNEEAAMELHMQNKREQGKILVKSKNPSTSPTETAMKEEGVSQSSSPQAAMTTDDSEAIPMDEDDDEEEISQAEWDASKYPNVLDEQKIRSWVALPWDHVLTWCFHTSDIQRRSMGLRCRILNIQESYVNPVTKRPDKRNKPFCWLVPDVQVRAIEQQYIRSWHDKVDVRDSLGEIGITIAPPLRQQGTLRNVSIKLRVQMYVIFWKKSEGDSRVAPKLLPTFPVFTQFVSDPFSELDMGKLKI